MPIYSCFFFSVNESNWLKLILIRPKCSLKTAKYTKFRFLGPILLAFRHMLSVNIQLNSSLDSDPNISSKTLQIIDVFELPIFFYLIFCTQRTYSPNLLQRIISQIASSVEIMDWRTNANKCEYFRRIAFKFNKSATFFFDMNEWIFHFQMKMQERQEFTVLVHNFEFDMHNNYCCL